MPQPGLGWPLALLLPVVAHCDDKEPGDYRVVSTWHARCDAYTLGFLIPSALASGHRYRPFYL